MTAFVTKAHLCRAILESTAFQAYDIFKAMESDSGIKTTELKVDGGMTNSEPLMEFQADLLGVPVIRPQVVGPPPWAPRSQPDCRSACIRIR